MICDGDKKNLLLSPPGPQLLLQTLQVPHTPHWHSELDGGADGPAGVGIDSDWDQLQLLNICFTSYQHHFPFDNI